MGFNFSSDFQVIQSLIKEEFFNPCLAHGGSSFVKNEKNMFCFDCCKSFCPYCLSDNEHHPHAYHRVLKIRRYMYNDVLLLKDAMEFIKCSKIQSYSTNGAKVLYLKQRPFTRPTRRSGNNNCIICTRFLQKPYILCSIECKVRDLTKTGKKCTEEEEEDDDDDDDYCIITSQTRALTKFDSRNMEDDDVDDKSLQECNLIDSQIIDLTKMEEEDGDNNLYECEVVEIPYWVSKLGIYKMASNSALKSLEFLRTNYYSDETSDDEGW